MHTEKYKQLNHMTVQGFEEFWQENANKVFNLSLRQTREFESFALAYYMEHQLKNSEEQQNVPFDLDLLLHVFIYKTHEPGSGSS